MTIPRNLFENVVFAVTEEKDFPPEVGDRSDQICVIALDFKDWDKIFGLFFLTPEQVDEFGMSMACGEFFPNFKEPLEVSDGPKIAKTLYPAFFQFFSDSAEGREELLKAREELLVQKGAKRTLH